MSEPLTLALVASSVVTEGIKFLYGQATEALKTWREARKDAAKARIVSSASQPSPTLFVGQLGPLEIHLDAVEPLEKSLLSLRQILAAHADGLETVDETTDTTLLEAVDTLRQSMEAIYHQRLTFVGEQRAESGPILDGTLNVERIAGQAAAIEARLVLSGTLTGRVVAREIAAGAVVHAIKVDTVGGRG